MSSLEQPLAAKDALGDLASLSYEQQAQLKEWERQVKTPQTFCDELQSAYCQRTLDAFIQKANDEFDRGEALDRFC
jgi:hypothetical protein